MITIHHLNNSRSQRVLWLLEELGVPYEIRRYERDAATMLAPEALRAVHPLGKAPVLAEGDLVVAETGAIVEYILERHGAGRLAPARDGADWWRFRHWMHHAEGSAMPPLVMSLVLGRLPAGLPPAAQPMARGMVEGLQAGFLAPNLERLKTYWHEALAATGWFAGPEMTAADIMMSFPLEAAASRSPFGEARPNPGAFLARVHTRPAYQRALERGGPYAYA
ncbi:glutathione S-transferase [Roseomonas nepalensis]|uniref:glutathione transferase n=1 Tax=Muricoccus nepalensis TaxID=1854500 RepID=A0A502G575_9PROT|nr:glutathione S-transferase [Roseomonas nepalensis]TPG56964.1 glutathione S-transferase [Roseomonas nepalensis]